MSHLHHLIKLANQFYDRAEDDTVEVIHKLIRAHVNIEVPSYKKAEKLLPLLICVRHGETELNSSSDPSKEKLRGWLNVPLDPDTGYIQAEKLGQYFMNMPVARIVTSDLQRASETAASIRRYTNVDVEVCNDLRPYNLGVYMGKPVHEYVPALLSHIHNIDEVPEGSTESFRQFLDRFYNKTRTLMDEAIAHPEKGAVMMVCHSRNTRAFRDLILEGSETKVEHMKKDTLLQEKDPTPTGNFVAAQYIDGKWSLVQLPGQEALKKA